PEALRTSLVVLRPRERVRHRLFERRGALPLVAGAAIAVGADLVHRGVDLDLVAVGIVELHARIAAGAAAALVENLDASRPEKIADLEKLRNAADLERDVIEAHLAALRQLVFILCLKQRDRVMVGAGAEKDHALLIAVGEFEAHDLRPEFAGALDVADAEDHVADLFHMDRRRFLFAFLGSPAAFSLRHKASFGCSPVLSRFWNMGPGLSRSDFRTRGDRAVIA